MLHPSKKKVKKESQDLFDRFKIILEYVCDKKKPSRDFENTYIIRQINSALSSV
jgi:hypothetical protein